jgi:uncharacterized repeat protein (TIGR03837 family)
MRWSVFCRVVDNFGDIGFAWRLAADLAARGEEVRLVVDDASALAWMAPRGRDGVTVVSDRATASEAMAAGDVLVETFGCGLPADVMALAARAATPPVCVNVEHLSAEDYVERSHGLPSPPATPSGEALPTWFFYPGFTARTGGLVREPALLARRLRFAAERDGPVSTGIVRRSPERRVSLFCYTNPALDPMLDALADEPTLLLLTPGPASAQAAALLGPSLVRGQLRGQFLQPLSQLEYDPLLWSCDINFVRGEDSLVRAIWAGSPFVWQIYPQEDEAHVAKLEAFLGRFLGRADPALARSIRATFLAWNGMDAPPPASSRLSRVALDAWAAHCRHFRDELATQTDLTSALIEFVASKR